MTELQADRRRPLVVGVRLSGKEMDALSHAAWQAGVTVATFLRDAALAKAPFARFGDCPACGQRLKVRKDGTVPYHRAVVLRHPGQMNCDGCHKPAVSVDA